MNLIKYSSILFFSFNICAMEINTSKEEHFPFEALPAELQWKVVEPRVRASINNHINNINDIRDIIKLNKIKKQIKLKKEGQDIDCRLLAECALADRNFLAISRSLVPQILVEEKMQNLFEERIAITIFNFAKSKGFEASTGCDYFGNKNYRISYKLAAPVQLIALLGDLPDNFVNKLEYTEEYASDCYIFTHEYRFINTFLIKSYLLDQDPKTLEILKFAFDKGLYITQNDFYVINQVVVMLNNTKLFEFLNNYIQDIAQEPQS